ARISRRIVSPARATAAEASSFAATTSVSVWVVSLAIAVDRPAEGLEAGEVLGVPRGAPGRLLGAEAAERGHEDRRLARRPAVEREVTVGRVVGQRDEVEHVRRQRPLRAGAQR